MLYPEKFSFENTTIQLKNSHSATYTYRLKPRELKTISMFLPISTRYKIEVDRLKRMAVDFSNGINRFVR